MSTEVDAALADAQRLLEPGAATPAGLAGNDARALAWALKALCYQAWSNEPPRAVGAAEALAALQRRGVPADQAQEIAGLAAWTAGIAQVTQGRLADAVHSFTTAGAAFAQAGLPGPAAESQVPRIMALSMLGRHDDAAACAEHAQRALREQGNLHAAGRVSQNLGGLHLHRHDYARAATHYREAGVLFARVSDHSQSISADIGLADTLTAQGDFDEALRIYARARMRAQTRGLELPLALADESAALVELARGRYREALAGLESARRRYEQLRMPQYLAIAEKQLGDAYLELRLLPEALALFDQAVAQFGALELPDEQAWALAQRGRTQLGLSDATGAAASFAAAAELFAAQANAVGQASVALARAELALTRAEPAAALAFAAQAAAGFAQAGQADGSARAEVIRADALLAAGRIAEAGAAFAATLERARRLRQLQVQLRCLTGSGRVAQSEGRDDDARAAFDAAIELFEDQRRALPGDEISAAFLTDHLRPFEARLRMALDAEPPADVLLHLERFRARALHERLAESPDPLRRRERLAWLYRQVQRHDADAAPVLGEELRRTEHDLLERVRRERLAAPPHAAAGPDDFSLAALQRELAAGDRLVEYGLSGDELFACIVGADGVHLVRHLAPWAVVQDAIRALRFQLDALRHGAAPLRHQMPLLTQRAQHRLQQLHALLWAPLAPRLRDAGRVILVPQGALGAVPFSALGDGQRTLGEQFTLTVAPSARVALHGLRRRPARALRVLALGESSRLPHAARETRHIAAQFADATALVGTEATIAALQAHCGAADVIHIACHALFRADNPRFSALQLADGSLTVDLAEALELNGSTVVLSGCETGLADVGDEAVGLVRAFLVAGAARVLASLWPVDDEVSAETMSYFYRALRGGTPAATALRQAQHSLRQRHAHPHFWAAFALYGGF